MRPNNASELCTSTPSRSSDTAGLNRPTCSVVNATRVPTEMTPVWPTAQ